VLLPARARLVLFVAAAALLLAALQCRQAPLSPVSGIDALLGDRARTPPPFSTGSCNLDLTGGKADTVFFVLGFLDEYLGRFFVEDDDRIERFYCNEQDKAALFRRLIVKLAGEQGLDPTLRDETTQQCLISYHSRGIADRLNSCYQYQATNDEAIRAADGTYRRTASASLGNYLFLRDGHGAGRGNGLSDEALHRRRALAYLAGAWTRYGSGDQFLFANSHEKATLIAQLLTGLGCHDVRFVEVTLGAPHTNWVRFEPTEEVKEWLARAW
jgi:hypothetical protein